MATITTGAVGAITRVLKAQSIDCQAFKTGPCYGNGQYCSQKAYQYDRPPVKCLLFSFTACLFFIIIHIYIFNAFVYMGKLVAKFT